jgi:hypothetical protein
VRIHRLELDIVFEAGSFHVFHTGMPDRSGDPPTIVRVNGQEFEGTVEYKEDGDSYEIKITKRREV